MEMAEKLQKCSLIDTPAWKNAARVTKVSDRLI